MSVSRAHILAHPEKNLTAHQVDAFEMLVARRETGEPVAYILGRKAFYDLELLVAPGALIPRPETEILVERALEILARKPHATIVDVGTGSGAIAVTIAAHAPGAAVYAIDISEQALNVARENSSALDLEIEFLQGDLLAPLLDCNIRVDCVLANLPYIRSDELATLAVARHEPRLALDGGADGLALIKRLLAQCPPVCTEDAHILLEIGADQGEAVMALVRETLGPGEAQLIQDLAGHDRIVHFMRRVDSGA